MIGVVGGVLAAVLWGTSSIAAARSSRLVGAEVALAWVLLGGLAIALPAAAVAGLPHPSARAIAWAAVAAPSGVAGIYLTYAALRRGPVVLVMPITASQGWLVAVVAVALGEHLAVLAALGLTVVMLGMYAVMRRPGGAAGEVPHPTGAIALAALCAVVSALALYGSARAGAELGAPWLLATFRVVGVLGFAVPVAASGRLRRPGRATRFVLFAALADAGAFASYVVGATHGSVAVPAVISSQFAAVAVVIGFLTMGERLTRAQLVGMVAILGGVALVTAAQS